MNDIDPHTIYRRGLYAEGNPMSRWRDGVLYDRPQLRAKDVLPGDVLALRRPGETFPSAEKVVSIQHDVDTVTLNFDGFSRDVSNSISVNAIQMGEYL